ncbi:predicted protein [Naegleria gruberi]|uniref:Predicted protein n=1 Tax=Naegleria gruberi TaxID=5762 RepID=D2UX33_NAEGR|nr:uncharacterized protein NAEGRDRAFT_61619 [Naegleria gruberi]EFC50863.1 predicted protein [Naegleria gruberi]|eukprot:XP_002683607.1 predicted protein [Naegleria gruberi strain NEG-M]
MNVHSAAAIGRGIKFHNIAKINNNVINNGDRNTWNDEVVRMIGSILSSSDLYTEENIKEKQVLISSLKRIKWKGESKYCMLNRALMNTFINSYSAHILKDSTAKRKSFQKFVEKPQVNDDSISEISNENNSFVNGKRYKYLMEKQLLSIGSIAISTFFYWYNYSEHSEAFLYPMLTVFTGREHHPSSSCPKEDFQFGMKAFSFFYKHHLELDYSERCWLSIFRACINYLHSHVPVEDCGTVLQHFVGLKFKTPLSSTWFESILLQNIEYFEDILPLVIGIFERNGMEKGLPESGLYQCLRNVDSEEEELSLAHTVVRFFKHLEKFTSRESIISRYLHSFLLDSICKLSDVYIDELLKLYPIDLEAVSFLDCAKLKITDKFLKIANKRGINFPLERIEEALFWRHYSQSSSFTIRYIMDTFNLDIFEIQERTGFLSNLLTSFKYIVDMKSHIDIIFPSLIVEWKKLSEIKGDEDIIKENILSIVHHCIGWTDCETNLHWLRNCFKPNIFDLDLLENTIHTVFNTEERLTLYHLTMINENLLLSEHTEKILSGEDYSDFMDQNFENYSRMDPRYLVALYRFVHRPSNDDDHMEFL